MLTIGNLAMRRARAQFASNFFGCAGFEIIDNIGFNSVEEAVSDYEKVNADIAVICSSDDEYAEYVPEFYNKLKDKAIVVVAGYPKDIVDDLKSIGIEHFIHIKSNVLETLKQMQEALSVAN
jgi:methylmalonyl-CoA mutase